MSCNNWSRNAPWTTAGAARQRPGKPILLQAVQQLCAIKSRRQQNPRQGKQPAAALPLPAANSEGHAYTPVHTDCCLFPGGGLQWSRGVLGECVVPGGCLGDGGGGGEDGGQGSQWCARGRDVCPTAHNSQPTAPVVPTPPPALTEASHSALRVLSSAQSVADLVVVWMGKHVHLGL